MTRIEKDAAREDRIDMEAIVDANGPEEQAMGWYYYLDDRIRFPFQARCIEVAVVSPLRQGEEVKVLKSVLADACETGCLWRSRGRQRTFAAPLAQLQPIEVDANTAEAIADWRYWVERRMSSERPRTRGTIAPNP